MSEATIGATHVPRMRIRKRWLFPQDGIFGLVELSGSFRRWLMHSNGWEAEARFQLLGFGVQVFLMHLYLPVEKQR